MSELSKRIANLSPEKLALLEKKRNEKKIAKSMRKSIPRRENLSVAPLSHAQQRLWFLNLLEPDSPFYNITQIFRVHGTINIESLSKALNAIIDRHETLRTSFKLEGEEPVQVISTKLTLYLPTVDINEPPGKRREAKIRNIISDITQQHFDLTCGPLIRFNLVRIDNQEYILVFVMHHIISDGWSMGIFNRELEAFYNSFSSGESYTPQDLPIQYADFSQWQRQWLKGEVLRKQLSYWKKHLEGAPSLLDLSTDRPRPAIQSYRGARESIILPLKLTEAIKSLSRRERGTLFMTMLAAFKIFLYRYTGVDDILVGIPIANRTRIETENLIGFFVNTLVLRSDLSWNPSFREFYQRVREVVLDAFAHQDLPFEKLVEELQPERSLSYPPLFQIMFAFQNDTSSSLDLSNLTLTPVKVDSKSSKFDLTMFVSETDQGLRVLMVYNTDLFNQDTIIRMLGHFQALLEGITNDPDISVSTLPTLTKDEQDQLLLEWNNTKVDYSHNKCVHQIFESQAEKTPDAIAVVYEDMQLTYKELNDRANQLAYYWREYGIGSDILVGICVERSIEMVITLLSILKAGGAYVPLDPSYPKERLKFMIDDSNLEILLSTKNLLKYLPDNNINKICLDDVWNLISKYKTENLSNIPNVRNLAYVIYTSGSTGKPKGVALEHEAVVNQMYWMQEKFKLNSSDLILHKTPYSFDVSVSELFFPLMSGSRIILAKAEGHKDPAYLIKLIQEYNVSIVQFVPSMLQVFLESKGVEKCVSIRWVICAGEALSYDLTSKFNSIIKAQLINLYGPTEAAIYASYWDCRQSLSQKVVPIGYPISNYKLYILDKYLQPIPIGVSGELFIGGVGLARGYINRPDLTAEKFIVNPFLKDSNERLYRTGDKACYLPDGAIKFLGRIDNQVKIRGFRIELGEIETVIDKHSGVNQVVVLVREDEPGNKRLVTYIVLENGHIPSSSELRDFLKKKLPEYMIPSVFIMLESIPLMPNGKVDRKALPIPDQNRPELEKEFVAPSTPTEIKLSDIWGRLLSLKEVGVNDNFFELGGHSLLATQLISRIRDTFQVEIPLRKVFEMPTVCDLAENLTTAIQSDRYSQAPPLKPVKRLGTVPLSFAQQRLWFLDQLEQESAFYNMFSSFRLTGVLDVPALHRALNAIVSRHETLRTSFKSEEGTPFQIIIPSIEIDLPVVDLTKFYENKRKTEFQSIAEEEVQRPFKLSEGPLIRCTLLLLDDSDHVLLLTMHHIISDGWSIGIFKRELSAFYNGFVTGLTPTFGELPIQYADFAHWQRQWLKGKALEKQLSYWKKCLEGAPPLLELPTDRPRPTVQSYRGARELIIFPCELSKAIKSLSRSERGTPFMTMLAAFKVLLYRYTGVDDILVGTPIANRTRMEIENLIGFFVNTLVLRSDLSGNPSFREFLHRVRETSLEAYVHQNLPFEKMVEELQPERNLSYSPLFQVMFALQNEASSTPNLANLTLTPVKVDSKTSKFDLTLFVSETDQGLRLLMEYSTDLFDSTTIERMLGHYQILLEGIIAEPKQRISDLSLLTKAECDQLLVKWNDTKVDYPEKLCISQLFEAQVERTPDSIAAVYMDTQLTYKELNARANRLAYYLRECGVGPNILVGICMDRSLDMIVGLLGILKAGGAYVPLDPSYPEGRLEFMLKDIKAVVILTEESLFESFTAGGVQVIDMDRVDEKISNYSMENLPNLSNSEDLAYVIYTSGSTGVPKGVEVPHRGVVRLLFGVDYVELGAKETFLQLAPVSFDASTFEIWGALLHGAKCVLFPERVPTPGDLGDVIKKYGVSVLWLTSSLFNTVIDEAPEELSSVKQLLIGGEALSVAHVCRALDLLPSTQIINGYGPTESTTFTCCYQIPLQLNKATSISIGRPIGNTEVYILDTHLNPVPVGVFGELCISGAGLARGYLNRPELTAERFVPNPFSKDSKSRLYKAGDIVRYLPDGNIEFSGRKDNQVKIRGFRIELGEVEAVLVQHSMVKQVVVLVIEDKPDNKRLVAYIVPEKEPKPTNSELREFLKTKLPEFMIPSIFVPIDSIPLTQHGKVDRKVLPRPEQYYHEEKNNFTEPRNDLELQLTKIWEKVLGVQLVGITDNFFELGGHSLLVVRLINEIKRTTGKKLGVKDIFHNPTILQLTESLMRENSSEPSSLIMIKPSGSKVPLFWVHDTFLVNYLDKDYPLYVLIHPTQDGKLPLHHSTVEEIATYYVQEIRKVQPKGPYVLGGYCFWAVIALEMARQLIKDGQEVSLLFLVNPSPRCLPVESSGATSQREGNHFKSRVNRQVGNIKHLQNTEKIAYVLQKFFSVFKSYKKKFYIGIKIAICKTYLFLGRPVPQRLIRFFVYNIYASKVQKKYLSQVYTGSVVIVQSEQDYGRDQSDWSKLSTHEVKIHVVPEAEHVDILREPYRTIWAKWLNMYLHRIKANNTGKEE